MDRVKDHLFALRSGFGWLSTIPVGISMEGIEAMMRHLYVFVVVGAVLGAIIGASAYVASSFLPRGIVAIIAVAVIYKLCGINHIDGLADLGDGIVAHGSIEKKIQAMKDVHMGTGATVFVALMLISLIIIVRDMPVALLPLALVASEVSAKQSMVAFASFSSSLQKGFGQMMIERAGMKDFFLGLLISIVVCVAVLGPLGIAALGASQVAAIYWVRVVKRNFGGATGDGIGATNEICRAVALGACLALGDALPWTLGGVLPWTLGGVLPWTLS